MDELLVACSEWTGGLYSTRQSWIDKNYDLLNEFRLTHGWDVLVKIINDHTDFNVSKKIFVNSMYRSKNKIGSSKSSLKVSAKREAKNTSIGLADKKSKFEKYINATSKALIIKYSLSDSDLIEAGCEGVYDSMAFYTLVKKFCEKIESSKDDGLLSKISNKG